MAWFVFDYSKLFWNLENGSPISILSLPIDFSLVSQAPPSVVTSPSRALYFLNSGCSTIDLEVKFGQAMASDIIIWVYEAVHYNTVRCNAMQSF